MARRRNSDHWWPWGTSGRTNPPGGRDRELREAERALASDPSPENYDRLKIARERAGLPPLCENCDGPTTEDFAKRSLAVMDSLLCRDCYLGALEEDHGSYHLDNYDESIDFSDDLLGECRLCDRAFRRYQARLVACDRCGRPGLPGEHQDEGRIVRGGGDVRLGEFRNARLCDGCASDLYDEDYLRRHPPRE